MLEGFPLQAFSNGVGVVTVIVIVGFMIFTGRLVPKRYYDEAVRRGDNYEKTARELLAQNSELITDKDLSLDLLRALRAYAQAKRGEDG